MKIISDVEAKTLMNNFETKYLKVVFFRHIIGVVESCLVMHFINTLTYTMTRHSYYNSTVCMSLDIILPVSYV